MSLDYAYVEGRFAVVRGDTTGDPDTDPDTVYCDQGTVTFTPVATTFRVAEADPDPLTIVAAPVVATIGTDGRLELNGVDGVWLLDLGSDQLNPQVSRSAAAYTVSFTNVRAAGQSVAIAPFGFHPVPGEDNDLTLLSPLAVVASVPITRGPKGEKGDKGDPGSTGPQGLVSDADLRLSDLAAIDRLSSAASARMVYDDTRSTQYIEDWSDLSAWGSVSTVQVSGGKLVSVASPNGLSGATHAISLAAGQSFRAVARLDLKAGGYGGMIGFHEGSAGAAWGAGGANLRGLYFEVGARVSKCDRAVMTDLGGALTGTKWVVALTATPDAYSVVAVNESTGDEVRARWDRNDADFPLNNVGIWVADANAAAGVAWMSYGEVTAITTLTPRTGLEDLTPTVQWSRIGGDKGIRVAVPADYDPRRPWPVVLGFHGNGTDETLFATEANSKAVAAAFVDAGYIFVSAAYSPYVSQWGATPSQDAAHEAYKLVRDHYSIGPVVLFGISMGGLESLIVLSQRVIPAVAWIGVVPATNLAAAYADADYTATIDASYGITGTAPHTYALKTAGHDPNLMDGAAFRGVPMWVLVATDDTQILPGPNFDTFEDKPGLGDITRVNATGGHGTAGIAASAGAMVAFADAQIAG